MEELKKDFIALFGEKRYEEILEQTNNTPMENGFYYGWDTSGFTQLKTKEQLLRFNLGTTIELMGPLT